MPPAVFHLPPETHRRTVVQGPMPGPSHAPMVRMISKSRWYSTAPSNSWTCPILVDNLDVQKNYERPFAAENDIDWALKHIPGISSVIPNLYNLS
jgi:hypothetical protein